MTVNIRLNNLSKMARTTASPADDRKEDVAANLDKQVTNFVEYFGQLDSQTKQVLVEINVVKERYKKLEEMPTDSPEYRKEKGEIKEMMVKIKVQCATIAKQYSEQFNTLISFSGQMGQLSS